MQKEIKYKIQFYSDWHAGSGLSAGSSHNSVVIKDDNHFPKVPGKTIKGLLKEATNDIGVNKYTDFLFGKGSEQGQKETKAQGCCFFSDACLSTKEQEALLGKTHFLYRTIASTSIDSALGVAEEKSLRKIEVCVPLALEGSILINSSDKEVVANAIADLKNALKAIKSMGLNRNRGLGRCDIKISGDN